MSQYANFYIKPQTGPYIPIGDYSRSSELYQIVQNQLPYGEIIPITEALIDRWIDRGNELFNSYLKRIDKYQEKKKEIFQYSNSAEEKYSLLEEIDDSIDGISQCAEEVRGAISAFYLFSHLIDAVRFEDGYDTNNYLYGGIETNPNAKGEEE